MTDLRFEPYTMPAADLGPQDVLPDISSTTDIHNTMKMDESIPEDEHESFRIGKVSSILPYMKLNNFNRVKKPRAFESAVLENEFLKATFIPELGGRLWSLYDKTDDKELLHVNPVFQPATLALRDAWVSGGVEWNIGTTGHTPFTVSPLFTATTELPDGTPVLRMYEWERIRRAAYQIDAYLPEDSRFLFLRVRIVNTGGADVPMYWWSNIAVNESEDTRVIVPADRCYKFDYSKALSKVGFPSYQDIDASYATNLNRSIDFFFDIEEPRRHFITALDGEGTGLVQTSTDRLIGRKLFLWGMGPGGRRWQEFLAEPGHRYIEIQAGLAHTQMQHLLMPADATWDWVEAYGQLKVDPTAAHGDWDGAREAADGELEKILPRQRLLDELSRLSTELDGTSVDPVSRGSGWGALERKRKAKEGQSLDVGDMVYDDASMDEEQAPWIELLDTGKMPCPDPDARPVSWMIQKEWQALLEDSITSGAGDHWYSQLNLGIMCSAARDFEGARKALAKSLEMQPSGWATYCVAVLTAKQDEDADAAADLYLKAARMLPGEVRLAVQTGKFLLETDKQSSFLELLPDLDPNVRSNGRIRFMEASASAALGQLDEAEAILMAGLVVDDVREGEVMLSDLWFQIQAERLVKSDGLDAEEALAKVKAELAVPDHLDFRMSTGN